MINKKLFEKLILDVGKYKLRKEHKNEIKKMGK